MGPCTAPGDPACWALLRALLRPLMWRNTKAEVAEEYRLPPRSLRVSYLTFQSGEKEVYDQASSAIIGRPPAVAWLSSAVSHFPAVLCELRFLPYCCDGLLLAAGPCTP